MVKKIEISNGDKVLISRTDRLGDLILALPFIDSFKNSYPESEVDVISSLYASPILENKESINKIIRVQYDQLISNRLYHKDLLNRIKSENYKAVIVLYPERKISRLYYKANIPIRIGTAGRFHSVFFNHRLLHSRKKNIKHESEYNLDFLSYFKKGKIIKKPIVKINESEINIAKKMLESIGVKDKFVLIHPGSGGSAENWSFENFIALYKKLEKENIKLVISGSDDEGNRIDKIVKKMNMNINKITGKTDIRILAAVLSLAEVAVANSTGPLHLAAAVGTKVVGLYPRKNAMSPVRWGPIGNDNIVLQPDVKECNCPPNNCKCMDSIAPDLVCQKVLSLLN